MVMNSLILSDTEIKRLKQLISEINLKEIPVTNEYELLRVEDHKINLILYKSRKIVFNQNQETEEILSSILQRETDYDYILDLIQKIQGALQGGTRNNLKTGFMQGRKGQLYFPVFLTGIA